MPFPDACCTQIHGTNRHQIKVGEYIGQSGDFIGFHGMAGKYTMLPLLHITDINDNGVMVGDYRTTRFDPISQTFEPNITGFVHTGSTFAPVFVPGMRNCSAKKISNQGTIVGDCESDEGNVAFLHFPDGTYQVLEVPFESFDGFGLTGINSEGGLGDLVGGYSGRGFVRLGGGAFKRVDVPGADTTIPKAIRGSTIVGISCAGLDCRGFTVQIATGRAGAGEQCCDWDETYREILVPGSTFTNVTDITANGELVGTWFAGSPPLHGFVATRR